MSTYRTIVADPPWPQKGGGSLKGREGFLDAGGRSLDLPYSTMTVDAIRELGCPAGPDAHLYLWTTSGFLEDAFSVVRAWGFTYSTSLVWTKPPVLQPGLRQPAPSRSSPPSRQRTAGVEAPKGEGRMTGAICGIPLEVRATEVEPPRWCFGERKRVGGVWTLRGPSFETLVATGAWGWADPIWEYSCDGCGDDRRAGFGGYYEGGG